MNKILKRSTTAAVLLMVAMAGTAHAQATTIVTRTATYDYDAYGQVVQQTVEPNDPLYKVVTVLGRDPTYGVVNTRTLNWHDPVSNTDKSRTVETLSND